MHSNPSRSVMKGVLLIVFMFMVMLSPKAGAQLNSAGWGEEADFVAGDESGAEQGMDGLTPEPISTAFTGSGWAVNVDISFRSPGPPQATTHVTGSHTSGVLSCLFGHGQADITFQFRVVQTQVPPVSVTLVPFTVAAQGTVTATPSGLPSSARAVFEMLSQFQGSFIYQEAVAVADVAPGISDSFTLNRLEQAQLDEVFSVNMTADAQLGACGPSPFGSGEAIAEIDPIIQVADLQIVGTGRPLSPRTEPCLLSTERSQLAPEVPGRQKPQRT